MCKADNLTTFICRLFWKIGASTSWNPQDLFRPVMGLLYIYLLYFCQSLRSLKEGLVCVYLSNWLRKVSPLFLYFLRTSNQQCVCSMTSAFGYRCSRQLRAECFTPWSPILVLVNYLNPECKPWNFFGWIGFKKSTAYMNY